MKNKSDGKIQVYTGDGKGKTTAALGLAIRALGRNKRVVIVYFDKGGDNYGERKILDQLKSDKFKYYVTGQIRFEAKTQKFRFGVTEADKHEAVRGLKIVEDIFNQNQIDLLILDELNTSISLGLLDLKPVLELLDKKPSELELILTGRNAPKEILDRADLITEMKMVKHYFNQGLKAREGIEY